VVLFSIFSLDLLVTKLVFQVQIIAMQNAAKQLLKSLSGGKFSAIIFTT